MSRIPIMAGNWKMNLSPSEAGQLAGEIRKAAEGFSQVERILCPAFPALSTVNQVLADSSIQVGAQNMHSEPAGSFTGEVSASMLVDLVSHVILGHSERREFAGETDADVNAKTLTALRHGLIPIVCVGESAEENQAGETQTVITRQLTRILEGVTPADMPRVIVAYEPVWAIGTGLAASPEQANHICGEVIRILIADLYDGDIAEQVRILYGGSTNASNIAGFMAERDIDGALIGGASMSGDSYSAMVEATAQGIA